MKHEIQPKFKQAAAVLMQTMGRYYENEFARQAAFAEALQTLFPLFRAASKGRARSEYTTTTVAPQVETTFIP